MGQAGLLTQAPPSTLWVNNCVDQDTHGLAGHRVWTLLSQAECSFAAQPHVTPYSRGNAALSKSGAFNPVRAALCEPWAGVPGSAGGLDTGRDFWQFWPPFYCLAHSRLFVRAVRAVQLRAFFFCEILTRFWNQLRKSVGKITHFDAILIRAHKKEGIESHFEIQRQTEQSTTRWQQNLRENLCWFYWILVLRWILGLALSPVGSSAATIDARCLSAAMSVVHGVVLKCPADTSRLHVPWMQIIRLGIR